MALRFGPRMKKKFRDKEKNLALMVCLRMVTYREVGVLNKDTELEECYYFSKGC